MVENKKKNIYILRKDLRIHFDFIEDATFYYFWNEENLDKEKRGDFYKKNLKKILAELKRDIEAKKGKMKIIQGGIIDKANSIIPPKFIGEVYIQKLYLPWEKEEEDYLFKNLKETLNIIDKDYLLTIPGEVLKDDGSPYVVFTPFYRKWQKVLYNKNKDIKDEKKNIKIMRGFFDQKIKNYIDDRDFPGKDGSSKFSKYLSLGMLSPLSLYNYSLKIKDLDLNREAFIRQLAWRDFYYHLYFYFPHVLNNSFKEKYNDIYWENNEEYFKKWKEGKTGYPFVDAGIRQLLTEGIMHNRLRMLTASFLTKDLLIDWKKGEEFFMEHLLDGDVILNNGGWQWSASTGADPQPYFRIFNPITQSQKFDPEGNYIKKYVPELSSIQIKYIHEPWKMPDIEQEKVGVIIGKDYPYPIVDHKEQRLKALELYKI